MPKCQNFRQLPYMQFKTSYTHIHLSFKLYKDVDSSIDGIGLSS